MSTLDDVVTYHMRYVDGDEGLAARAELTTLTNVLLEVDRAIRDGDLIWKRKRQSDSDPYHLANLALTKAMTLLVANAPAPQAGQAQTTPDERMWDE